MKNKMKKHSHSWVDEYKGTTRIPLRCRLCPKTFNKGKKTPNKAFGKQEI